MATQPKPTNSPRATKPQGTEATTQAVANPVGPVAGALAWLASFLQQAKTPICFEPSRGATVLQYADGRREIVNHDPEPKRYNFGDARDFARWVALHAHLAANADQGPTKNPWRPVVKVHPEMNGAEFAVDPYGHTSAKLHLRTTPAFETLRELEKAQRWTDQKTAYELARLDLADLLPSETTATLERARFQIGQQIARTVGPAKDQGLREFSQTTEDEFASSFGRFSINAPIFETGAGEPVQFFATIQMDLAYKIDAEPLFRLAPLRGECDRALWYAAGLLAETIEQELHNHLATTDQAAPVPEVLICQ